MAKLVCHGRIIRDISNYVCYKTMSSTLFFVFCKQIVNKIRVRFETDTDRLAIITPDRYTEACDVMAKYFVPDEPLCISFGVTWCEEFHHQAIDVLRKNLSLCLINKENDEIMGVRLTEVMKRSDPPFNPAESPDQPIRDLLTFAHHKDSEFDVYDRIGSDEAMHFFTLAVHRKYRQLGIGSRLLRAAVAMCKEQGIKGIKGEGSSNFSQRIYEKEGFDTILTVSYEEYKLPSGRTIRETSGEHTCMKLYVMAL